jgi:hypothetical protein
MSAKRRSWNLRERLVSVKATLLNTPAAVSVVLLLAGGYAFAQSGGLNPRLSDDIIPAPDGYEAVAANYIVTRSTDLYISPFIWGGKVLGVHLNAGQSVDALAKLKGYDWLLVGKNGTGIGYVPLSVLSPAK